MFFRGVEERKCYLKMERVNVLLTWVHQLSWLFLELRHEFATASQRSKETFARVLMGAGGGGNCLCCGHYARQNALGSCPGSGGSARFPPGQSSATGSAAIEHLMYAVSRWVARSPPAIYNCQLEQE